MASDESYISSSDNPSPFHSEANRQSRQDLESTLKPEIANLWQSYDALLQRINRLTGVLIGTGLLMIGCLVWLAYQNRPQTELVQPPSGSEESTAVESIALLDRLTEVEKQLQSLSEQTPDNLRSQVEVNQTQLAAIAEQIKQVEDNAENLQNLTEAVRKMTEREADSDADAPFTGPIAEPTLSPSSESESSQSTDNP